jgi:hypothetical protein
MRIADEQEGEQPRATELEVDQVADAQAAAAHHPRDREREKGVRDNSWLAARGKIVPDTIVPTPLFLCMPSSPSIAGAFLPTYCFELTGSV